MSATRWCGSSLDIARSRSLISSPCEPWSSRRIFLSADEASSRTCPSSSMAFSIASSTPRLTMSGSTCPARTAVTTGDALPRKDSRVRRELRSSAPTTRRSVAASEAPSSLSRVSAEPASGTPCSCHGSSPEMSDRTAAMRECSRSMASRSVTGRSSRTRSAPSGDVARSEMRASVRGNSMTFRAWLFTTGVYFGDVPGCTA